MTRMSRMIHMKSLTIPCPTRLLLHGRLRTVTNPIRIISPRRQDLDLVKVVPHDRTTQLTTHLHLVRLLPRSRMVILLRQVQSHMPHDLTR